MSPCINGRAQGRLESAREFNAASTANRDPVRLELQAATFGLGLERTILDEAAQEVAWTDNFEVTGRRVSLDTREVQ
jgi:hypothetical protein